MAADPALIDSPLMRSAGPELLSLAFMDARNHTLHLLKHYQAAMESGNFEASPQAGVESPLWLAGHIGWFQEWWIARNLQRTMGTRCKPEPMRLASIEPGADLWWNPAQRSPTARWASDLPDLPTSRAYLLGTLESTLELLEKTPAHAVADDDTLYFYRLALFHEDLQCEALAAAAQAMGLPLDKPLRDAFTPPPLQVREPLLIPATAWQAGSRPGAGFAFDNEEPAHAVQVPAFEIDAQAITWSQFVEFVDDGGYDREELWSAGGWRWLQAQAAGDGRRAPRDVEQIGVASGAVMQTRFGQRMRMQGNQPAMHMTWWEADAWCRWAGRRLPFEVEWEVAAGTAARRGFRWGDVWEWTANSFQPYAGFVAGPWQDYSQHAFGTHRVLRGASFATRARMKAPAFRNFQLPERDDIFCGFRSCAL
ncbi:MAG: selenoneine synthase SenA [Polaromonas sp.]|nr:selenoneine synthase SenA [Polaromonas sp.]